MKRAEGVERGWVKLDIYVKDLKGKEEENEG